MGQLEKTILSGIDRLEDYAINQPQVDIRTIERIIGTMYSREIIIPKGTTITSKVYKRAYVDIMLSGDITITDTNGTSRLTGCNILEGPAGRKRAGFAHKETRWITVHDARDIKSNPIEDISFDKISKHREYESELARKSYLIFLESNNLLGHEIKDQSDNEPYTPLEDVDFHVGISQIEGAGVFVNRRFLAAEIIGPLVVNGSKTQLGRYVNHSHYPNCGYKGDSLMSVISIDTGQELTLNYNTSKRCAR